MNSVFSEQTIAKFTISKYLYRVLIVYLLVSSSVHMKMDHLCRLTEPTLCTPTLIILLLNYYSFNSLSPLCSPFLNICFGFELPDFLGKSCTMLLQS